MKIFQKVIWGYFFETPCRFSPSDDRAAKTSRLDSRLQARPMSSCGVRPSVCLSYSRTVLKSAGPKHILGLVSPSGRNAVIVFPQQTVNVMAVFRRKPPNGGDGGECWHGMKHMTIFYQSLGLKWYDIGLYLVWNACCAWKKSPFDVTRSSWRRRPVRQDELRRVVGHCVRMLFVTPLGTTQYNTCMSQCQRDSAWPELSLASNGRCFHYILYAYIVFYIYLRQRRTYMFSFVCLSDC